MGYIVNVIDTSVKTGVYIKEVNLTVSIYVNILIYDKY